MGFILRTGDVEKSGTVHSETHFPTEEWSILQTGMSCCVDEKNETSHQVELILISFVVVVKNKRDFSFFFFLSHDNPF